MSTVLAPTASQQLQHDTICIMNASTFVTVFLSLIHPFSFFVLLLHLLVSLLVDFRFVFVNNLLNSK